VGPHRIRVSSGEDTGEERRSGPKGAAPARVQGGKAVAVAQVAGGVLRRFSSASSFFLSLFFSPSPTVTHRCQASTAMLESCELIIEAMQKMKKN